MKFVSLTAAAVLAFALPTFADTLTYSKEYDNPALPLTSVACSTGVNGLITKGYTTLGSLPTFPNVGGVYGTTWNSTACGACYQLTYGNNQIRVIGVDYADDGFNLSEEAMNTLTDGRAVELGKVDVFAAEMDPWVCGL